MSIPLLLGRTKPLANSECPFVTWLPAVVMTLAGSRSAARQWLPSRYAVPPASTDTFAELADFY